MRYKDKGPEMSFHERVIPMTFQLHTKLAIGFAENPNF